MQFFQKTWQEIKNITPNFLQNLQKDVVRKLIFERLKIFTELYSYQYRDTDTYTLGAIKIKSSLRIKVHIIIFLKVLRKRNFFQYFSSSFPLISTAGSKMGGGGNCANINIVLHQDFFQKKAEINIFLKFFLLRSTGAYSNKNVKCWLSLCCFNLPLFPF